MTVRKKASVRIELIRSAAVCGPLEWVPAAIFPGPKPHFAVRHSRLASTSAAGNANSVSMSAVDSVEADQHLDRLASQIIGSGNKRMQEYASRGQSRSGFSYSAISNSANTTARVASFRCATRFTFLQTKSKRCADAANDERLSIESVGS